jgi:hypothetical protein
MDEPLIVESPPNDPELGNFDHSHSLGTNNENPAESCIDILLNGGPK